MTGGDAGLIEVSFVASKALSANVLTFNKRKCLSIPVSLGVVTSSSDANDGDGKETLGAGGGGARGVLLKTLFSQSTPPPTDPNGFVVFFLQFDFASRIFSLFD